MKTVVIALASLIVFVAAATPSQAADACKECREFLKVCRQAHSKAACQTDYSICIKHCRQK